MTTRPPPKREKPHTMHNLFLRPPTATPQHHTSAPNLLARRQQAPGASTHRARPCREGHQRQHPAPTTWTTTARLPAPRASPPVHPDGPSTDASGRPPPPEDGRQPTRSGRAGPGSATPSPAADRTTPARSRSRRSGILSPASRHRRPRRAWRLPAPPRDESHPRHHLAAGGRRHRGTEAGGSGGEGSRRGGRRRRGISSPVPPGVRHVRAGVTCQALVT